MISEAAEYREWHHDRLVDELDTLCEQKAELLKALEDLVPLALAAMREANNDGAEYDYDGELKDARTAIAKAKGDA